MRGQAFRKGETKGPEDQSSTQDEHAAIAEQRKHELKALRDSLPDLFRFTSLLSSLALLLTAMAKARLCLAYHSPKELVVDVLAYYVVTDVSNCCLGYPCVPIRRLTPFYRFG